MNTTYNRTQNMIAENNVVLGSFTKLPFDSILLLKADTNYTQVYLTDGRSFLSSTSLGILENRLKDKCFFRANRSLVINLNYMIDFEVNTAELKMKNNDVFVVSRRRLKGLLQIKNQINNNLN
jgi:DNA-binding LytR/AlgR family response regulator